MNRAIPALLASAALLAACNRDRTDDSYNQPRYDDRTNPSNRTDPNQPNSTTRPRSESVNPETRILSILHAKNEEEIKFGRLAQERGSSADVKQFGEMLVKDHTELDDQVARTAQAAGITLMDDNDVKWMLAREKGTTPGQDPTAQLGMKSGEEFDREFSQKMHSGHQELISLI